MSRVQGVVKWFSNKKGYGFIEPTSENAPTKEDIFVHQSSVTSEGYRTLIEGWEVEFDPVKDDDGKLKADNVTAVGGGPCTGPRRQPRAKKESQSGEDGGEGGENTNRSASKGGAGGKQRSSKPRELNWHHVLNQQVKDSLVQKSIRHVTGTIDVSVDTCRIKLGTRGYVSLASSELHLAEGKFACDENGVITFEWERALKFDGDWQSRSTDGLLSTITLTDDNVLPVGIDETSETLFGGEKPDPLSALESNGFQMRRVVLTAKGKSQRRDQQKQKQEEETS